jgi:endonuclease/exonuclease/phosphatase family metal-dependent hydrolase
MKLTTLNLQGFTDWEQRKPEIVEYLKTTDPDIILFQEVVFLPDMSPFNQVQILNQELGYPYEHSAITRLQPSPHHDVYREGLSMLSKHPVMKSNTIVLKQEEGDEHNRILQLVDVLIDEQTVKLANVHFSLTDDTDFATAHLLETLDIMSGHGEKRIIAGDFNIDRLEDLSDVWEDEYEASTKIPYVSFPAENKRNDYVLVPKPYSLKGLSTSSDKLSDHTAVTFEIDTLLYQPNLTIHRRKSSTYLPRQVVKQLLKILPAKERVYNK